MLSHSLHACALHNAIFQLLGGSIQKVKIHFKNIIVIVNAMAGIRM